MDAQALLNVLVSTVGVVGFLFGLYQYYQAQKWKRLEFAAAQLQRLSSEPELKLATLFLNYSRRGVPLPETYWNYANAKVFEHDCKHMYTYLQQHYTNEVSFFIYSDTIDCLFEYLDQIYSFIDMKLITVKDVSSLRWILDVIEKPQWAEKEGFDTCLLMKRAKMTGHDKVIALMRLFDYQIERCLRTADS